MSTRYALLACFIAAALITAGCTTTSGRNFSRPDASSITMGQTTEADIESRYGVPSSRDGGERRSPTAGSKQGGPFDQAQAPGFFTALKYEFLTQQAPVNGNKLDRKGAVFTFYENALVGYDFNSSFTGDNANFDEAAFRDVLAQRQITRSQVLERFGEPGGRFVYPLTPTQGVERVRYSYSVYDVPTLQRRTKSVEIVFDASGRTLDFRTANTVTPFTITKPAPTAGGVVLIPAYRYRGGGGGRR